MMLQKLPLILFFRELLLSVFLQKCKDQCPQGEGHYLLVFLPDPVHQVSPTNIPNLDRLRQG